MPEMPPHPKDPCGCFGFFNTEVAAAKAQYAIDGDLPAYTARIAAAITALSTCLSNCPEVNTP